MYEFANFSYIFILPLILGGLIRFLLRKRSKAWIMTIVFAVGAFAAYLVAMDPPVAGSELYGIRLMQSFCLFNGSLITGCFVRLWNGRNKS